MSLISVQIIDNLNKAKSEFERLITEGKLSNYESYKYYIGIVHGLKHAIEICHETVKRNNE